MISLARQDDDWRITSIGQPAAETQASRDRNLGGYRGDLPRTTGLVQVVDLALVLGHGAGDAVADHGGDDTLRFDDLVGPHDAALELLVGL